MTVNERIRQLRQTLGMTQTGFSKAIYVSNGYTAEIENGHRVANDRIIRLVCLTFGANEQWLKTGEGEMFKTSPVEQKERVVLMVRFAQFEIKKPQILNRNKDLPQSIPANVIYVKEEKPPKGLEPTEWFLMTNEEVNGCEQAFEKVRYWYYVQRWKIGRFHHVLKSGCAIEKLQERDMEKTKTLILMYSVIAVFILNLTCIARVNPELPCGILFDEDEWKVLYCAANRRKEAPEKPYTTGEAVEYIGNPGGPRRAPSDGPPGVKQFGGVYKNSTPSTAIGKCSILWVKFSALRRGFFILDHYY